MVDFIKVELINSFGLSDILAILSFAIALFSIYFTSKQVRQMNSSLFVEIVLKISDGEYLLLENCNIVESISDKSSEEYSKAYEGYQKIVKQVCNLYELACIMYLEGQVDKTIFKKYFGNEISKMCVNEDSNSFALALYDETGKETYKAIFEVRNLLAKDYDNQ